MESHNFQLFFMSTSNYSLSFYMQTISCVLMFAMERAEFPVDTHVWHITKKLGWVPPTCSRESCYEHLNNRIPDSLKFALHVLLVDHGKVCKACSKGGCAKSVDKNHVIHISHLLRLHEVMNTNSVDINSSNI